MDPVLEWYRVQNHAPGRGAGAEHEGVGEAGGDGGVAGGEGGAEVHASEDGLPDAWRRGGHEETGYAVINAEGGGEEGKEGQEGDGDG